MNNHLSSLDAAIIEKELPRKSAGDIAFLIDQPVEEVAAYIKSFCQDKKIISHQQLLDEKKKVKKPRAPRSKKVKEKKPQIISRIIEREQKVKRDRSGKPIFKTKEIDLSRQQEVRIDRRTCIYINPGEDPVKAKEKYLQKLIEHKSRMLAAS